MYVVSVSAKRELAAIAWWMWGPDCEGVSLSTLANIFASLQEDGTLQVQFQVLLGKIMNIFVQLLPYYLRLKVPQKIIQFL